MEPCRGGLAVCIQFTHFSPEVCAVWAQPGNPKATLNCSFPRLNINRALLLHPECMGRSLFRGLGRNPQLHCSIST